MSKKDKDANQKKLLFSVTQKDFELQFFRCSGPGGQAINKVERGCRVVHRASGAAAESCTYNSQSQNKEAAFSRLVQTKEFKRWHRLETARVMLNYQSIEKMIEDQVNQQMNPYNIKVEVRDETGHWIEIDTSLE